MSFEKKLVRLFHQGWSPKELAQRLYLRFDYLNEILRQAAFFSEKELLVRVNRQVTLMPFIGPSGSGKIITLAKYASFLKKKKDLLLLTSDDYSLGGWDKLRECASILNLRGDYYDSFFNYFKERSPEIHSLEAFNTVLIDTPGNIIQEEFREILAKIISLFDGEINIKYTFVIDMSYLLSDHYSAIISSYSSFHPQEVVITRADYLGIIDGNSLTEHSEKICSEVKMRIQSILPSIQKVLISSGEEIPGKLIEIN